MSTSPYFISKLLKAWRNSGKERDLMLMLLDKPSDHLLRDVGMTRDEALYITGLCHLRVDLVGTHRERSRDDYW
jgi:uncharacterized protein YjiS (DUF1127 family)